MVISKESSTEELSQWNDDMVRKYHKEGTLFESKNFLLRWVELLRLKTIVGMAEISKDDSVLDLGCGEGYCLTLIPRAKKILGVDISKVALERAKKLVAERKINAALEFGDAQNLKIKGKFDKILCSEVLEHVPNPEKVMENVYSVLNPNGLLIVSIPDEIRIQKIMSLLRKLGLLRFLHAARKQEDYDWHLHEASVPFLKEISEGYFRIIDIKRVPPISKHRIVASLRKV